MSHGALKLRSNLYVAMFSSDSADGCEMGTLANAGIISSFEAGIF